MPRSVQRLVHVALPWLFWVFGACAESHQVPEADPAIARAAAQASGRLGHAGLPGVVAAPLTPRTVFGAGVGFRSSQAQREHYEKHRREFGRITNAEYLARAQSLRDTTVGGPILEVRRDDGTISRFNRTDGSFVAFDTNGTLRTFFRPNDGETYFRRQAVRRSFR